MPSVTDSPPPEISADLQALRTELDERVPVRELDQNRVIVPWNIRAFGGLAEKWVSEERNHTERTPHLRVFIYWSSRGTPYS